MKSEWISVKDRLPQEGVKVLVCGLGNNYVEIDYISDPKDGNLWELWWEISSIFI